MKAWQMIEGLTVADVAYEAYGKTMDELFTNSAKGLMEVMVDTATIKPSANFQFSIFNFQLDGLLFDFLSELVFLKDAKNMLFSKFKVKIKKPEASRYSLDAILWGEEINPQKHHLRLDVKAITRHQFSLKKEKERYIARAVLDI